MTSSWQAALIKCKYEPRFIPVLLALLRILMCLWPQTGYIHSDEFFQSPEIIAKRYFHSNVQPVWEFTTKKPIRCMLVPNILNTIGFKFATTIQANPSAYLLLVAPRFIYTLLSFIIDYCLYKLCQYYSSRGLWYLPVSVVFQTSFVCLACLTRTFGNVPEVVIFALLLLVVCRAIKPRFRIVFVTPRRKTPANEKIKRSTQLISSLLIGFLTTLGTFNRPTFPAFAVVPLIYWALDSFRRNSHDFILTLYRVVLPVAASSVITAGLLIVYDTSFYKQQVPRGWVITPYNFVTYNTDVSNLSKYGLHSPYMHMFVNLPLAFNILALMFYARLVNYRFLFSTHRVYSLMLLSTLTSVILLSFIPHQEFRFLLPLIVPLVYAFAFNVYTSNKLLTTWLLCNIVLIYFYSSVHQSGVVKASLDLDPVLRSHARTDPRENENMVHVLNLRSYYTPSYQWNIPEDDPRFEFHLQNSFESFNLSLSSKLNDLMQHRALNGKHQLYFMLPSLYDSHLKSFLQQNYSINMNHLRLLRHYYPHFSGEDIHNSIEHIRKFGLSTWKTAFGFSLYTLDSISLVTQDPPPKNIQEPPDAEL